jgi:hypothetical protein
MSISSGRKEDPFVQQEFAPLSITAFALSGQFTALPLQE